MNEKHNSNTPVNADDLLSLDFSSGLNQVEREILASLIEPIQLPSQHVLFRTGDPADSCYLIDSGLIALEICAAGVGCRRIGTASKGELIGWSPFLPGACFTASARTLQPSQVLRISATQLSAACEQNPQFGYRILTRVVGVLATRINACRLQMLDLFGPEGRTGNASAPEEGLKR